jgi:hypothetical protein
VLQVKADHHGVDLVSVKVPEKFIPHVHEG